MDNVQNCDRLIYHRYKPLDSVNLLSLSRRRDVFPVRYGRIYRYY
jgi:hypothetical protein